MAKRQSHKQSRIGKEMEATLDLWCLTPDPEQKQKLNDHYFMLRKEWEQAGWERRFPHHDRNGDEIKKEQEEPHSDPD